MILVTVEKGKLAMDDQQKLALARYVRTLKDGDYQLSLKKKRGLRTSKKPDEISNQNGYYWAVVIPILSNHLGYAPDEMHEAIKYKFLRKGGSDSLPKIGSTAKLDKWEWEQLMEIIRIWALSDLGVAIPLPNES